MSLHFIRSISIKRIFQKLHRWLGLALFLPLVLSGLSGSYLIGEKMFADMMPARMAVFTGTLLSVDVLAEKALAVGQADNNGKPMRIGFMRMPEKTGDPVMFFLQPEQRQNPDEANKGQTPKRRGTRLMLDPATGQKVTLETSSFSRMLHDYHANMLIPQYSGRTIVGWWGVALLFFSISGVVLWWPKKGKLKQSLKVKTGTSPYRFNRDLHSVGGIWLGALLILSSFTGTAIVFPEVIKSGVRVFSATENTAFEDLKATPLSLEERPAIAKSVKNDDVKRPFVSLREQLTPESMFPERSEGSHQKIQSSSISSLITLARQNDPTLTLYNVRFPEKLTSPYQIGFLKEGQSFDKPPVVVYVDAAKQNIMAVDDPENWSAGRGFMAWMRPLHEGRGLGWWWQFLTLITGLMPAFFAYTGVRMYVVRQMNKPKTNPSYVKNDDLVKIK